MDNSADRDTSDKSDVDRVKLKEERKLRNKQKKIAKKLEKQKEWEQKELLLKLQPKSSNVTLITRDFADKVVGNTSGMVSHKQEFIDTSDFPALTDMGNRMKRHTLPFPIIESSSEKRKLSKLELADFLCAPNTVVKQTKTVLISESYSGNPLDSDMPVRKRGKHRETDRPKHHSKLKRDILNEQNDCDKNKDNNESCLLSETEICDNIIIKELDDAVRSFVSGVVGLQEKLYNRDPIKGVAKRRYVVGLHEAKKYLKLNKIKMLIIAPDIKLTKSDGALFCTIKDIITLTKANSVQYVFALKRKQLGILTLKYIPVSCIAVLNFEGLEEQFKDVLKLLQSAKKEEKCDELKAVENDVNLKFLNNLMEALKSK